MRLRQRTLIVATALSWLACSTSSPSPDGATTTTTDDGGTTAADDGSTTSPTDGGADVSAAPEPCNGLDDNGNGSVDEGCPCQAGASVACFVGPASLAGIGACTKGAQSCQAGVWSTCAGSVAPSAETCGNLIDDDCNGSADEGCECSPGAVRSCFGGTPAQNGVGTCKPGTQTCLANATWDTCAGQVLPSPIDACDKLDEDCSGVADQDCVCNAGDTQPCYTGDPATKNVGPCHGGTATCANKVTGGSAWGTCVGEVVPTAETNYVDDSDCTGANEYVCVYTGKLVAGNNKVLPGNPHEDGTGAAARFGHVEGMARDPSTGDLIVLDGSRLRRITQAGVVTTASTTSYPSTYGSVVVTTDGTIWVAGPSSLGRIPKVGAESTLSWSNLSGGAPIVSAMAAAGNDLWIGYYDAVSAANNAIITRVDGTAAATGTSYAQTGLQFLIGFAATGSGPLYFTSYSPVSGTPSGIYRLPLPGSSTLEIAFPEFSRRLALDAAGHVFTENGVYSPTGRLLARAPATTSEAFLYGAVPIDGSTVWGAVSGYVQSSELSEVWRFEGCPLP